MIVKGRLTLPGSAVAEAVEIARKTETNIRKKATEIYDNSFAEDLEKSGFLKEIWGGRVP